MNDIEWKTDRLKRYRAELAAISMLRQKKSEVITDMALWQNTYHAQYDVAKLKSKVDDLDLARKRIIIVYFTGVGMLVGSFAVTQALARSGGTAYKILSMATPVTTTGSRLVGASGASITTVGTRTIGLTFKQYILAQVLQTSFISVPVSVALHKYAGGSTMGEVVKLIDSAVTSKPQTPSLRPVSLTAASQRSHTLEFSTTPIQPELLARYIAENLVGSPEAVKAMLLMNRIERIEWKHRFRKDVNTMLQNNYPDLSEADQSVLLNNLMWEFFNELKNLLNATDKFWWADSKLLQDAIEKQETSIQRIRSRQLQQGETCQDSR